MKGICFKEPLFLAAIEGRKTQTRRILNPQPDYFRLVGTSEINCCNTPFSNSEMIVPRYKVDETLYLKEPYLFGKHGIIYKYGNSEMEHQIKGWNNKLFMPEKYARYFIEIIEVCCERLQDIRDDDCLKEGIIKLENPPVIGYPFGISFPYNNGITKSNWQQPKEAYAALIDNINGKGTWESNPYVWVYNYRFLNKYKDR